MLDDVPDDAWALVKRLDPAGSRDSVDMTKVQERIRLGDIPAEFGSAPDAPIVVSTIHRAKGLEFDRVVLFEPGEPLAEDRDDLPERTRQLYVALTRARRQYGYLSRRAREYANRQGNPGEVWVVRGFAGRRKYVKEVEVQGGHSWKQDPAGAFGFDGDPAEIQEYIDREVKPFDPLLLRRTAVDLGDGPRYVLRHGAQRSRRRRRRHRMDHLKVCATRSSSATGRRNRGGHRRVCRYGRRYLGRWNTGRAQFIRDMAARAAIRSRKAAVELTLSKVHLEECYDFRARLVHQVAKDLIGPGSEDETIADAPLDQYITGVLYPRGDAVEAQEDDGSDAESGGDESAASDPPVAMANVRTHRLWGSPSPLTQAVLRARTRSPFASSLLPRVTSPSGTHEGQPRRGRIGRVTSPGNDAPSTPDRTISTPEATPATTNRYRTRREACRRASTIHARP